MFRPINMLAIVASVAITVSVAVADNSPTTSAAKPADSKVEKTLPELVNEEIKTYQEKVKPLSTLELRRQQFGVFFARLTVIKSDYESKFTGTEDEIEAKLFNDPNFIFIHELYVQLLPFSTKANSCKKAEADIRNSLVSNYSQSSPANDKSLDDYQTLALKILTCTCQQKCN